MRTIGTMRFTRPDKAFRRLSGVVLLAALLLGACSDGHETGERGGASIGYALTGLQEGEETGKRGAATPAAVTESAPRLEITAIERGTPENGKEPYPHTL